MAKIIIYEDDAIDLIRRYSRFTKEHDIHVRYPKRNMCFSEGLYSEEIEEAGFNLKNFREGFYPIDEADVYFLDGLGGECLYIAERLPKEKVWIYSGDHFINEKAERKGINAVNGRSNMRSLELIVQDLIKS